MKITFGKYQGRDTEELAKFTDGRSYLAWGIENLKSPMWRQEFQRALDIVKATDIDVNLEAKSIMQDDPQIDPRDAQKLAEATKADRVKSENFANSFKVARENVEASLKAASVPAQMVARITRMIVDDSLDECIRGGAIRFSSVQNEQKIRAIASEYQKRD